MQFLPDLDLRKRIMLAYAGLICIAGLVALAARPDQVCGILVMLAAGLVVAWGTTSFTVRFLRRRVHRLRESTDALSRGDLSEGLERLPRDEFVKLTHSLEDLVEHLEGMARERENLRERLTRSEKLALIGELAATVAHEINNPLDGLQNSVRIIRRDPENFVQTRQLLDLMEPGLYRIEMSVRRLMTLARDEPVALADTPLDSVIDEAAGFVQPRFDRLGIELVRDYPETPVLARADRVQLTQTLINLMINAADAMPGGGKLIVRCRSLGNGERVVLSLSDTGCGISEADRAHIFEPFFTTKGQGRGTGLGLPVVARIIEAHDGKIDVASTPEAGTRFDIELPGAGSMKEPSAERSAPRQVAPRQKL